MEIEKKAASPKIPTDPNEQVGGDRRGPIPAAAPENSVSASSVQIPGVLMTKTDGVGHTWTIPAESTQDYEVHKSPYALKHLPGYDPDFAYQFEHVDDVPAMVTEEWYPVGRKELGLPAAPARITAEYGLPYGDAHQVGNQICVKKPKILKDRQEAAYKRYADTIVGQIAPPRDSAKQRLENQPNGIVTDSIRSETSFKEP